jgi:hypothetical protein
LNFDDLRLVVELDVEVDEVVDELSKFSFFIFVFMASNTKGVPNVFDRSFCFLFLASGSNEFLVALAGASFVCSFRFFPLVFSLFAASAFNLFKLEFDLELLSSLFLGRAPKKPLQFLAPHLHLAFSLLKQSKL